MIRCLHVNISCKCDWWIGGYDLLMKVTIFDGRLIANNIEILTIHQKHATVRI